MGMDIAVLGVDPRVFDRPVGTINSAAVGSSPCVLDPGADLLAVVERITISRTTLEIELAEGMAEDSSERIVVIPWAPCWKRSVATGKRRELCRKIGDGVNQAADLISATASIPSLNFIPLTTFGNWF